MAFRWFRQNKQATKWLYIGITIFVMVTFTVTGAMLDGLSDDSAERVAGRFVTKGGETVEVKAVDLRNLSYRLGRLSGGRIEDEGVWRHIMLETLADEAGIVVGDDVLKRYIRSTLLQARVQSQQEYEQFLRMLNLSQPAFEELMRSSARQDLYQQLADDPPRVLSEAVYDRFKTENEEFRVEYVAFVDDAIRADLEATEPSEDELKSFYEDDMSAVRKANDFSTPERYGLDAAVLDLASADSAAMRALLPENQREIADREVETFYDSHLDRYLVEEDDAASDENESEEGESSDDEDEEGDEGADEEEDVESYRDLDEVRPEIEKEILATRLINTAVGEYNTLKFERDRKEAEEAADDSNESDESNDESEAADDGDLLDEIAEKYGLERVDFGAPILLEGIAELDRIGGKDLESVRFLPEGGVRPRHPTDDIPYAAVVRMKEKVAAEPKPFAEVKDDLPDAWREETAQKRAEEAALAFWDALTAKAREAVAEEVEKLEQEATELADAMIEKDSVEDDEQKQAIRDRETAAMKPRIEALLAPHRGEHFEAVANEQGLTIEATDWFRKSYRSTAFYRDEEPSPAKFLKGHFPIFETEVGGVLGPLRDAAGGSSLVARVKERRFPSPSDMTLKDRSAAEMRVRQEVDPDYLMRRFGRASAFDFEKLSRELRLERFEERAAEEEEEGEPRN